MKEIFKNIPCFPNHEISNFGTVRQIHTGKLIKCYPTGINNPSPRFGIRYNKKGLQRQVASVVAELFVQNPNGFRRYIYKDFDCLNVKASNIVWVSNSDFAVYCFRGKHGKKKRYDTRQNQIAVFERNIKVANLFLEYLKDDDLTKVNNIILLFDKEIKTCISKYTCVADKRNECYQFTVFSFLDACSRNIVTTTNIESYLCGIVKKYFLRLRDEKIKYVEFNDSRAYLNVM